MIKYGTAICKESISLFTWDGTDDEFFIQLGDKLDITYHEYDGSIGLSKGGVESYCPSDKRKCFEEDWA